MDIVRGQLPATSTWPPLGKAASTRVAAILPVFLSRFITKLSLSTSTFCTLILRSAMETFSKSPGQHVCTTKPTKTTISDGSNIGARTILGAGSSSVVHLVDGNKAEKRFESSEDLLNEQAIYQILGSHPRLLSIYHIGADSITMDWMKQGDLARFIQSNPETTQRRKHHWITQIAESFSLLHMHHISHCDSKLENFLLDDNYDIRICDFASSHNYRAPTNDPAIQPARYRRAVDDFSPAVFNPADDIFAFGSICYEIITGGPPYAELDDESVGFQFTRGNFPATKELSFGPVMSDCWNGKFVSFEAILRAIENEAGEAHHEPGFKFWPKECNYDSREVSNDL